MPVPPWAKATIARPTIVSRNRFPIISAAPTAQLSAAADEAKIASITVAIAATMPVVRWIPLIVGIVGVDQFIGALSYANILRAHTRAGERSGKIGC